MSSSIVNFDDARNRKRSSSTSASGTESFVYDDIIADIVEAYLDEIDPALTGVPAPPPSTIKAEILQRTNMRIDLVNGGDRGNDRLTRLKMLTPSQIAAILMRLHHVVTITANGLGTNKDYDLIGIYTEEGIDRGLYSTSESQIGSIARRYNGEISINGTKEVMQILRERAPQVRRSTDRDLIPVNNGVFNYATGELMDFDPSMVFLSKARVDFNPYAESPVIHNDADGTDWELTEWVAELSDDPEIVSLLWQVMGATVRPNVRWKKTAWFYSEVGNNGKGTFCELMRNVVGEASCAAIPLANFGKDFMLEPLINASAIIVDENDVGTYLDKVANLKAVVTNDVISINRKNRIPINYRFWGFMVQCLNEFPLVRDRSESFYRRQLFIPFEKNFKGIERAYIKDDYLQRRDVLEFALKHVLVDLDPYYELPEPEATKRVLSSYKVANDPVREFWDEHESRFAWDLLPFGFLYDVYKAWFAKTNPSGKPLGKNKFIESLMPVINDSTIWYCRNKTASIRTGSKMDRPELLIAQYDLVDWKAPGYTGANPLVACVPQKAVSYRGLERYIAGGLVTTDQDDYTSAFPDDEDQPHG